MVFEKYTSFATLEIMNTAAKARQTSLARFFELRISLLR